MLGQWPTISKDLKRSKGESYEVKRSRVGVLESSKKFNVHWEARARVLGSVKVD